MEYDWDDIKDEQATAAQRRAIYRWMFVDPQKITDLVRNMSVDEAASLLKLFSGVANRMIVQKSEATADLAVEGR